MRDVKIVLLDSSYDNYDDCCISTIRHGISDWESISDEDYKFLKENMWRLQSKYRNHTIMLIEKDPVMVIQRIASIKQWVQEEQDKTAKEEAARKAAQEEKARKRLLKKAGNELKLLEELKKKYPEAM